MSKPFSFFSLRRSSHPSSGVAETAVESQGEAPIQADSALVSGLSEAVASLPEPVVAHLTPGVLDEGASDQRGESLFFREMPHAASCTPPPQSIPASGLLSMVVEPEEPMIPPNQRLFPEANAQGSTSAARSAQPAHPASSAPSLWPTGGTVPPTPTPLPGSWSPGQITSREIAQLRMEMREEIEQVKNDLFGAAMGVSALKDRLDGLEAQVAKASEKPPGPPSPTLEDLQAWITQRVEQAVQAAVERALEAVNQRADSTLSSSDFYRMPVRVRPPDRPSLSEAPMILSSCPT